MMPYHPNKLRRSLANSSIIRYLYINLKINQLHDKIKSFFIHANEVYNENTELDSIRSNYNEILMAVDYVLCALKKENPDKLIIIMIDALRSDIYKKNTDGSNLLCLHNILKDKCIKYGLTFIDLTESFSDIYNLSLKKYESEYDWHWNEHGHETAAIVLYKKLHEMGVTN